MSDCRYEVRFNKKIFEIPNGNTLLDAALEQGIAIPFSCRSGLCHNCLVKVKEGDIPIKSQEGLSESQKLQSQVLACQFTVSSDVVIESADATIKHSAKIIEQQTLNDSVLCLRLQSALTWFPGQYLTIWKNDRIGRPYSIASLPSDEFLEFHIKLHKNGEVSNWLAHPGLKQHNLKISEPVGNCFYTEGMANKRLLLVGYGTGLAPLYGVARDALQQQHPQDIYFYVVGHKGHQLYYQQELQELARQHSNFYVSTYISAAGDADSINKDIIAMLTEAHPKLQGWCVFLCGAPELIKKLQRTCFLNGASLKDIHADPFITTATKK